MVIVKNEISFCKIMYEAIQIVMVIACRYEKCLMNYIDHMTDNEESLN